MSDTTYTDNSKVNAGLIKENAELKAELEVQLREASPWIKCSERLPIEGHHYLVALTDPEDIGWLTEKPWTAFYNKGGEWDCCDPVEDGQPVTHWMPLPRLPEEDNQ